MNKYLDLIQKSKEYIDQGFDTFGRELQTKDQIGGFLVLCTFRAAGLSDAIVHLCKADFTDESLPILRSLIETAVNMRWIMSKDTQKRQERLKQYYANLAEDKWYGEPWTSVNLRDRMKEIGFKGKLEAYYDLVVKFCHDYTHGGARILPHRRLISKASKKTLMSAGAIYAITSQMLGHVSRALNDHWPGKFDSYKIIWKAIKNSQPT